MIFFRCVKLAPQSGEQTKETLYSERASFVPPKKNTRPQPPILTGDISQKVKRLNSQKKFFFRSKNEVQTTILYSFKSISFAPPINLIKNPAPTCIRYLTGGHPPKIRSKRQKWIHSIAFYMCF